MKSAQATRHPQPEPKAHPHLDVQLIEIVQGAVGYVLVTGIALALFVVLPGVML